MLDRRRVASLLATRRSRHFRRQPWPPRGHLAASWPKRRQNAVIRCQLAATMATMAGHRGNPRGHAGKHRQHGANAANDRGQTARAAWGGDQSPDRAHRSSGPPSARPRGPDRDASEPSKQQRLHRRQRVLHEVRFVAHRPTPKRALAGPRTQPSHRATARPRAVAVHHVAEESKRAARLRWRRFDPRRQAALRQQPLDDRTARVRHARSRITEHDMSSMYRMYAGTLSTRLAKWSTPDKNTLAKS